MKQKRLYFLPLLFSIMALCVTSCSSDESEEPATTTQSISGYEPSDLQQDFYADQTTPNSFSFTTDEAWSIDLTESSKSDDSFWVEVSPMSGSAGNNEITITINEENTTGESRSVIVTIVGNSGSSLLNITVTQSVEATPEEEEEKEEEEEEEEEEEGFYLADFDTMTTLPEDDLWVIIDKSASSIDDYAGLRSALATAYDEDRKISLEFPNLLEVAVGYEGTSHVSGNVYEAVYYGAFLDCTSLESVLLPVATEIGQTAFADCTSLAYVSLPVAETIGYNAFAGCTSLETVSLPVAETIGRRAFMQCTSLASVSLPAATTIERSAFIYCTSLENVYLPVATTFEYTVFSGCTSLESVSLPVATTFGYSVFTECTSLESVSIPAAETMGSDMFYGCTSLTSLTVATQSEIESADETYSPLTNTVVTIGAKNSAWYEITVEGYYFAGAQCKEIIVQ